MRRALLVIMALVGLGVMAAPASALTQREVEPNDSSGLADFISPGLFRVGVVRGYSDYDQFRWWGGRVEVRIYNTSRSGGPIHVSAPLRLGRFLRLSR